MTIPTVSFIDGGPPDADDTAHIGAPQWLAFVVGVLSSQPDRWAIIKDAHGNAGHRMNLYGEKYGVVVEAVKRHGVVYARVCSE